MHTIVKGDNGVKECKTKQIFKMAKDWFEKQHQSQVSYAVKAKEELIQGKFHGLS